MTEREDLDRLGIGVRADPQPLRMPGEEPRRRVGHIVVWALLVVACAGAFTAASLALITPAPK